MKNISVVFVLTLFITLLGFNISVANASNCAPGDLFSSVTGQPCNVAQTPLSATLSPDTPPSGDIIADQAIADLLHVIFTGTNTINTIVLKRFGASDQNTLLNVYLYDGNVRLTDGYAFNNIDTLTMSGLNIPVNGSRTISVKADVANVVNADSLGIELTGFTATGQTPANVSIKGNEMTYNTANLPSVWVNSASQTIFPASVNVGTNGYTIWSSPIQVNIRAVSLKGANFRIVGSAPADALNNIRLYVDGVSAGNPATIAKIDDLNYAMFDFSTNPVSLSSGTHTISLRADIVKGASYVFIVSLQQASDLVIFDPQVGINIILKKNATTGYFTSAAGMISINSGRVSVVVDPAFQSATTSVSGGAVGTAIARFKVNTFNEDIKVFYISVSPNLSSCTPMCAGLQNVTLFLNGLQIGSSQNWNGSGAMFFALGSPIILTVGTDNYIKIKADIKNLNGTNYTGGAVSAGLNVGFGNAIARSSKMTLDFPNSTVVGSLLTIK